MHDKVCVCVHVYAQELGMFNCLYVGMSVLRVILCVGFLLLTMCI